MAMILMVRMKAMVIIFSFNNDYQDIIIIIITIANGTIGFHGRNHHHDISTIA